MRRPAPGTATAGDTSIPFVAYATDCVMAGVIALESERLADLLSAAAAYEVRHATVEPLGDGPPLELADVLVVRDELCVVAGTGPRGNPDRRIRTRPHPVYARVGPYEAWGYIHAAPNADAIAVARSRQIIAMTNGWIRYPRLGRFVERAHPTMLLNRQLLEVLEDAPAQHVDGSLFAAEAAEAATTPR
jgi:hypothetical protein